MSGNTVALQRRLAEAGKVHCDTYALSRNGENVRHNQKPGFRKHMSYGLLMSLGDYGIGPASRGLTIQMHLLLFNHKGPLYNGWSFLHIFTPVSVCMWNKCMISPMPWHTFSQSQKSHGQAFLSYSDLYRCVYTVINEHTFCVLLLY